MNLSKDLKELIDILNETFDEEIQTELKNADEREFWRYHFGIGTTIRNIIFTNKDLGIIKIFESKSVSHPDNMSNVIINIYNKYLNHISIKIEDCICDHNRDMEWFMERKIDAKDDNE